MTSVINKTILVNVEWKLLDVLFVSIQKLSLKNTYKQNICTKDNEP